MNILAFDTASSSGAVAIMKDGAIIAHTQLNIGLTHSEQLLPAVDDLMQLTGMKMAQLDAIAITAGPGSFTGLRIGFSTAKGMALGLKKPAHPAFDAGRAGTKWRRCARAHRADHERPPQTGVYGSLPLKWAGDHAPERLSGDRHRRSFAGDQSGGRSAAGVFHWRWRGCFCRYRSRYPRRTGCAREGCENLSAPMRWQLLAEKEAAAWADLHGMRVEPMYPRDPKR